jgi:hypothetical protein
MCYENIFEDYQLNTGWTPKQVIKLFNDNISIRIEVDNPYCLIREGVDIIVGDRLANKKDIIELAEKIRDFGSFKRYLEKFSKKFTPSISNTILKINRRIFELKKNDVSHYNDSRKPFYDKIIKYANPDFQLMYNKCLYEEAIMFVEKNLKKYDTEYIDYIEKKEKNRLTMGNIQKNFGLRSWEIEELYHLYMNYDEKFIALCGKDYVAFIGNLCFVI